jgi:L-ascorbate metabolism protein UlaG (beta-lactamase superfamily)
MKIKVKSLGQSGFRFQFGDVVVYTDPYLSDHVAESEGAEMHRLFPVTIEPGAVTDADFVLISHAHLDHCDFSTVLPLARASSKCMIVCPNEVARSLKGRGISDKRLIAAREEWIGLGEGLRVMPVPAAHTEIEHDTDGLLRYVGYVIEYQGRRIYHAGDTSPAMALLERLKQLTPIDTAFLPVNERNFYRERRGIIGNMSVREAFQMATDIGVKVLVPIHWDMFAPNSVYLEEIELLYRLMQPSFDMKVYPEEI